MKWQKILCCQSGSFQASEPRGEKSRACSPFAGWWSPGSLCRALLGFGSKLLLHSLPCFSDIWLQCSNGQHNL